MSKFDEYMREKALLDQAVRWHSLIGKPYNGGGRGVGYLYKATTSMEIYHQEYNRSKNYHDSNEIQGLNGYLNEATKTVGNAVIDLALKMWSKRVSELAGQAKLEYDELVRDAESGGSNEQE